MSVIDVIIGGDDVKNEKPDPEGLLTAIQKLNVSKNQALYVGDSIVDANSIPLMFFYIIQAILISRSVGVCPRIPLVNITFYKLNIVFFAIFFYCR